MAEIMANLNLSILVLCLLLLLLFPIKIETQIYYGYGSYSGQQTPLIRSFGETCDATSSSSSYSRCNPTSHLTCNANGICQCRFGESRQLYDPQKQICYIKVGQSCIGHTLLGLLHSPMPLLPPCVPNAHCSKSRPHRCICDSDYVSTPSGQCVPKLNIGSVCTSNSQCKNSPSVQCWNGRCDCTMKNYETGRCIVGHGDKCLGTIDCEPGLVCLNGECLCEFPSQQNYNTQLKRCQSIVNGPCGPKTAYDPNPIECMDGAFCTQTTTSAITNEDDDEDSIVAAGTCQCPFGRREDSNGRCTLLDFGQPCNDTWLFASSGLRCDKSASLFCRDGICACSDPLKYYDSNTKLCRGLVGSLCNPELNEENVHSYLGMTKESRQKQQEQQQQRNNQARAFGSNNNNRGHVLGFVGIVGNVDLVGYSTLCGANSTCMEDPMHPSGQPIYHCQCPIGQKLTSLRTCREDTR